MTQNIQKRENLVNMQKGYGSHDSLLWPNTTVQHRRWTTQANFKTIGLFHFFMLFESSCLQIVSHFHEIEGKGLIEADVNQLLFKLPQQLWGQKDDFCFGLKISNWVSGIHFHISVPEKSWMSSKSLIFGWDPAKWNPPSTMCLTPVIIRASSEARNKMDLAISSRWTGLAMGWYAFPPLRKNWN